MSQIQSNVGLITGIPIQETVDQLMAVAAKPRDTLKQRTEGLVAERTALDQVGSLLLAFRLSATQLNSASVYSATKATSSDESLLSVSAKADPPPKPGSYTFTPLQTASSHQLVSSSFSDIASQLSSGTFRIGVGGRVDQGIRLSELNSGQGVATGSIRIVDRSGATADIDLRTAMTVDDVLDAINTNSSVRVSASVEGDSIKLTDSSGGAGNLRVLEVGLGTTAAGLGLAGVNVAADEATGSDVFALHSGSLLSSLNDGAGVRLRSEVDDLEIALADSTVLSIDLGEATTLGQVVDAINSADETKLAASISADGNRLELTDLTGGAGAFTVTSVGTGTAAEDLGLTETASDGTITGRRLAAGLRDTLLTSLNGGHGYGELGAIEIVDRAGNPAVQVDLSTAETLADVVNLINESGSQITAAINSSRNGISLTDGSGGSGNLTISSADAHNTAEALGLAIDDAIGTVNSGSLNRQTISESTRLDTLNGGRGVSLGSFRITDSSGAQSAVNLNSLGNPAQTVGDVIDAINSLTIDVEARINDTGDGIVLTDLAGGAGTLTVAEVGSGNAAADLRLLGASNQSDDAGQQIIDGRTSFEVDLSTVEVSDSVALSTLNNGSGISLGSFRVTDSTGENSFFVQLDEPGNEAFTVQDVIDKINERATAAGVDVSASLNAAGTGIQLTDTAGGSENLTVEDLGSGTSAAELLIAGEATTSFGGAQSINGQGLFVAQDANKNGLDALVEQINSFDGGFTASTFFDGTGYRLAISSESTGSASELLVDASGASFSMQEVSRAKDAVLQIGNSTSGGIVITSSDNTFENVASGLDVSIEKASTDPVTVEVTKDSSKLTSAAEEFVESFNSLRTTLEKLTAFDEDAATTGLLFGRSEVIRVEQDLARVLTGRFSSSSTFKSLETLGISLNDKGRLELDDDKLVASLETNPAELERFLTSDKSGVIDQLHAAIDRLAGDDNALIARRYDALTDTIEGNQTRIDSMTDFLDRERERTLMEFYRLEETVSRLQSNIDVLESIQFIQPARASRS